MFLHFHRGRKRGKREIVKPCFFVLRRRTLTFGAALLMAVITQGTLFSMVALSFPAWLVLIVLALLVVPIQMAFERVFDRCSALLEARRQRRKGARQTFRDQRREQ